MSKIEELFSHSAMIAFASNTPVPAPELPGWFRLEHGRMHLFLVSRRVGGEYGRRPFLATLQAGDCFPACAFVETDEEPGVQYGYLLVPQTGVSGRALAEETFAAFARENPAESGALIRKLIAILSAAYGTAAGDAAGAAYGTDAGAAALRFADLMVLPESLRALIRQTRAAIVRRERENEAAIAAEQRYEQDKLFDQFTRLQSIVRPGRQESWKSAAALPAALRIIAEKYHLTIHVEPSGGGAADPEQELMEFCRVNQWRVRRIRLEDGFSRLRHGMLIGFDAEAGRFCILELKGDESCWYFPGERKAHPLTPETESEVRREAWCFYENLPLRALSWRDLVRFVFRGSREVFFCILLVGIVVGLSGLVTPVATDYVTGKIIPTTNLGELRQLLFLLLALALGTAILNVVPQFCLLLFGSATLERLMAALFDRLFRLPVDFFRRNSAGDLCSRLFSVLHLQEMVFQVMSQQFISSIFALCSVVMLFYYSWKLAVVAIVLAAGDLLLLFFLFEKLQKPLRIAAEKVGWESGFLRQVFDGIARVRGAGAEERIENRFLDEFILEKQACDRYFSGAGAQEVAGVVIPAVTSLLFYFLIGKEWKGSMEVSEFLAFLTAYGSFQAAVVAIGARLWQLGTQKPELERLKLFLASDVESSEGKTQAGKLDGSLEFSHVTFGYSPDQPPVLRDVSFSVKPGEFVAIVGPSGAGKSSLIRLLLGFECPGNGSILYSGRDLRELDVNSVRRQLGVILQNSRIMQGSILDNITTGIDCSTAEVEEAIRLAALDREIAALPMGIYTHIREGVLSGGQQQRVLIARALVGKPAVVIMDESTSALDNETQEEVRRNIETLYVTRIIVAHRLSTIINADRIYVLDQGGIRETGTFEELMSRDGVFRKLAQRQLL